MSTWHLDVKVEKHKHSRKDSVVQKHINISQSCKDSEYLSDNFSILKTCNTQNSTKIQEMLLTKNTIQNLKHNYMPNFFSFLLNVSYFICSC